MNFCTRWLVAAMAISVSVQVSAQDEGAPGKLDTAKAKASYGIGYNIGSSIKREGLDLDVKILAAAIADALAGKDAALEPAVVQAAIEELAKEKSAKKLKDNAEWLAANAKKEGVKVTKSGLQYLVIKEGTGATPTTESRVETHYRGKLLDGTVFDGSYDGDEPAESDQTISFGVTQVIRGWTEALQLMKTGAHYRLFIPSELAYGERGSGRAIGPNEVLIFEIYLVGIEK